MSDAERLLAAFESGKLLRPSPDIPNTVDLSRAIAQLTRADGAKSTAASREISASIGPADHIIFILVDGLGMNIVAGLPEDTFLSAHCEFDLRAVFPSATAVALTSIATGEWPSTHGVTGWWTHISEINAAAAILPFVRRSDGSPLPSLGVTSEDAFPTPSLIGSMKRDFMALLPVNIAASAFSSYFAAGRPVRGYRSLHEAVDLALERSRNAEGPTFTYLYTQRVDEAAHRYGLARPELRAAALDLDRQLERLEVGLAGRSRIVLSADHGFLDVSDAEKHHIRGPDPLLTYLRCPPSGDARVLYFHVQEGASEKVENRFRERFGERFVLISTDEAEDMRLFGPEPCSPLARARMGDLIAISTGRDVIEYRPAGGVGRIAAEVSHHSGLTPDEMRVPLVIA